MTRHRALFYLILAVFCAHSVLLPSAVSADQPRSRHGPVTLTAGVTNNDVTAAVQDGSGPSGSSDGKEKSTGNDTLRPAAHLPQISGACVAQGDAWFYDQANGGPNCNGSTVNSRGSGSFADDARAVQRSVPWPSINMDMNPRLATVAVPTYYWIQNYAGQDMSASAILTRRDGETCHDVLPAEDTPDAAPRQECSPNMITYQMTVTAHPATYRWTFGDGATPRR